MRMALEVPDASIVGSGRDGISGTAVFYMTDECEMNIRFVETDLGKQVRDSITLRSVYL